MMTRRTRSTLALTILGALLLATGTAVALTSGPTLVGKNGVSPVLLFGKSDVRTNLTSDWDHDNMTIGFQAISSLGINRSLGIRAEGGSTLIYLPISISDETEGDYMGIIEVTMDGDAVDSMRTVLRESWDRDVSSSTWTDRFSSLAIVQDGAGPVDDGDLLVSRQEVTANGELAMVVYCVDLDSPSLTEIYRVEGATIPLSGRLAAMRDGSGAFVMAEELVSWSGTAFEGSSMFGQIIRFQSRYAVGDDGFLYGTLNVSDSPGSGDNRGVYQVDPAQIDEYVRVGTTKMNGVWKAVSATFDARKKLWLVDRKASDYFLSKMNRRGKLPFKKRIAEWNATDECARLVELETLGSSFYAVVLDTQSDSFPANTGTDEEVQVWRLDP